MLDLLTQRVRFSEYGPLMEMSRKLCYPPRMPLRGTVLRRPTNLTENALNNKFLGLQSYSSGFISSSMSYRCMSRHHCALRVRKCCNSNNLQGFGSRLLQNATNYIQIRFLTFSQRKKRKYLNECRWLHSLFQMTIRYKHCPQPPRWIPRKGLPALGHQSNSERLFLRKLKIMFTTQACLLGDSL